MTDTHASLPGTAAANPFLRGAFIRGLAAAIIVAGGVATMDGLEKALHLTFNKQPMPLQKALSELPRNLGNPLAYTADGPDESMNEETLEVLGTHDYLLRAYRDVNLEPENPQSKLHLNLNYYSRGSSTPHVPEICWAGAGMDEAKDQRQVFEVPGVVRRDGTTVTLRVRLISFKRPDSETTGRYKHVAYLFAVNGDYVANAREVTSRFWKASNKYAYDTKIEVTVGDSNQFTTQEEAKQAVSAFLKVALPSIEGCLPDPQHTGPAGGVKPVQGVTK